MTKFMFKCLSIIAVLLFGVLLGIQKTHTEMDKLKGVSNDTAIVKKDATQVTSSQNIDTEVTSHDLKAKQEILRKIDSFNIFSALGERLTSWVSSVFSLMVSFLGFIIKEMLNVFSP